MSKKSDVEMYEKMFLKHHIAAEAADRKLKEASNLVRIECDSEQNEVRFVYQQNPNKSIQRQGAVNEF